MPVPRFHIAIHGRPHELGTGAPIAIAGQVVEPLLPLPSISQVPLPVTFEEAEAELTKLPRLFFEPDGSFGWFAEPDTPRWEVGGLLYDRGDRVMYAELNGVCPPDELRQLLQALGARQAPLLVQLVEEAIFLDAETFCQVLESNS